MRAIYFAKSDRFVYIEQITQQPCFTSLQCIMIILSVSLRKQGSVNYIKEIILFWLSLVQESLNQIYSFVFSALFNKKLPKPSDKRSSNSFFAVQIQSTLKKIIYNVWVLGKQNKPLFLSKMKNNQNKEIKKNKVVCESRLLFKVFDDFIFLFLLSHIN